MKSYTQSGRRLYELIVLTFFGVLMYVAQAVMAPLPNIELVSLLVILTARAFGSRSLLSVYIFVGCEVLTYGVSLWVLNYLYIWAILAGLVCLIRKIDNTVVYALISAIFGLLFGTLCAIPNFFIGGFGFGMSYIISGLWFDLLHCGGNLLLTLLLYRPLTLAMDTISKKIYR